MMVFLTLLMAFVLAFAAACGKADDGDDDEDDDTSTEQTDEQIIKNGNFEFGTSGTDVTFPVYTGINWTKSKDSLSGEDADTSDITSGIIDTADEAFEKIEEDKRPHTNPKVHAGAKEDETKVLMIANKSKKEDANYATAQKFTSTTTLSLEQNSYVKVSFWVLTQGLELKDGADAGLTDRDGNAGNPERESEFGANVALVNKLGSASQVTVKLTDINTYGEWKQYSFYVKASDYTSSSVQIAVGLGQASETVIENAVAGRAYFDDFTYSVVSEEAYEAAKTNEVAAVTKADPDDAGKFVIQDGVAFNRAQDDYSEESIDFSLGTTCMTSGDDKDKNAACFEFTRTNGSSPVSLNANAGLTQDVSGKTAPQYTENDGLQGKASAQYVKDNLSYFSKAFEGTVPFDLSGDAVYIGIKKPTSYTVNLTDNFEVKDHQSDDQSYYMLSFWVKTSEIVNGSKAPVAVQLIDKGPAGTAAKEYLYNTSFSGIDTTPDADAEEDETTPDFGGWKRYTFFVTNNYTSGSRYFTLRFTYGPTDLQSVEDPDLDYAMPGWAVFAGFEQSDLTEKEYNAATTGDYAKKTALYAGYQSDSNDSSFDSAQASMGDAYKYRPVAPQNYLGVPANHSAVNKGSNLSYTAEGVTSGLVHADYAANYSDSALSDAPYISDASFFSGCSKKTLMIATKSGASYGYLGATATVSANSFATVSVRVRTGGGATASVYLADMSTERTKRDSETEDNPKYLSPLEFVMPDAREDLYTGRAKSYSFTGIVSENGWTTYTFYIATGDFAKSYRIELWNGTRDNANTSNGYVFFDLNGTSIQSSSDETNFKAAMDELDLLNEEKFTQFKISDDDTTKYKEQTVYAEAKEYGSETVNAKFYDLRTAEKLDAQDEEDDSDEEDNSGSLDDAGNDPSVWLLVSSLIIAVALIVTIILILVRKATERRKKKYTKVRHGYNAASRAKLKRKSEFDETDESGYEGADEQPEQPEAQETPAEESETPAEQSESDEDKKDE